MLILYAAMRHDYGRREQGFSFEHWNYYDTLSRMGHDILYFDFLSIEAAKGREAMNRRLLEVARAEKPALLFTVLFRDEIDPSTIRRVADEAGVPTANWFNDDDWRFDDFTRRYAPCYTRVVTTSKAALPRYAALGLNNVHHGQFACNHFHFRRLDRPREIDVAFVGQPHGHRRAIIEGLRASGIDARAYGQGFEAGRLSQEEMIDLFNRTRINLNLSAVSSGAVPLAKRLRAHAQVLAAASVSRLPGGKRLKAGLKRLRGSGNDDRPWDGSLAPPGHATQIKARIFEVAGCGAFVLTDPAQGLEDYYEPGKEIVLASDGRQLLDRIRLYLRDDAAREAIASAAHRRTLDAHTYVHRFCDLLAVMGLDRRPPASFLDGAVPPGRTVEIS